MSHVRPSQVTGLKTWLASKLSAGGFDRLYIDHKAPSGQFEQLPGDGWTLSELLEVGEAVAVLDELVAEAHAAQGEGTYKLRVYPPGERPERRLTIVPATQGPRASAQPRTDPNAAMRDVTGPMQRMFDGMTRRMGDLEDRQQGERAASMDLVVSLMETQRDLVDMSHRQQRDQEKERHELMLRMVDLEHELSSGMWASVGQSLGPMLPVMLPSLLALVGQLGAWLAQQTGRAAPPALDPRWVAEQMRQAQDTTSEDDLADAQFHSSPDDDVDGAEPIQAEDGSAGSANDSDDDQATGSTVEPASSEPETNA